MLFPETDMIPLSPHRFSRILFIHLLVLFLLLGGCAKKLQLTVIKPAEINTTGIKKVAVGHFELVRVNTIFKLERNGVWESRERFLTEAQEKALSNQVRARVISQLSTVPYFNLVYKDEFAALEADADMQKAVAAIGYTSADVDAVINGKVWIDVVITDGVEIAKTDLEYRQGGRQGTFNYDVEILSYWPYKSINGTMALELKLTRLNPTEVLAVTFDSRSYSDKVGGKPADLQAKVAQGTYALSSQAAESGSGGKQINEIEESDLVLPSFNQLVANLSESIAAQFSRKISLTLKKVNYSIASSGNKTAVMLIEAGAYEKAIQVLTEALNRAEEKKADDYYNLGLCFEAVGDYGLAAVSYTDAINLKPESLLYAQGIGRIDRMKRENRKLKQQLDSKE
jgi:tetratricopeptide (TPR) repeat protein